MWVVMMVAMMLPSASPMVLLYARVVRHAEAQGGAFTPRAAITAFASGYLAIVDSFQPVGGRRSVWA